METIHDHPDAADRETCGNRRQRSRCCEYSAPYNTENILQMTLTSEDKERKSQVLGHLHPPRST
jgi:hypothetical protein